MTAAIRTDGNRRSSRSCRNPAPRRGMPAAQRPTCEIQWNERFFFVCAVAAALSGLLLLLLLRPKDRQAANVEPPPAA
ncbi:hypothetical protein BC2230_11291 [Burkholderia cepacia]